MAAIITKIASLALLFFDSTAKMLFSTTKDDCP
jgi:hypothetical protein